MKKLLKFDFLGGYKTYVIGILMVLHGGSQLILDFVNSGTFKDVDVQEILTGFGFITLRKGVR